MLNILKVSRLAVLDEVELSFSPGLTVLTGETGAGKSLVVDALGLIMGGRCPGEIIASGAAEASVEAVFDADRTVTQRLAEFGLPAGDGEVSVRRVLTSGGRSRMFINGALTTAAIARKLFEGVVEIAGQHEHMALFEPQAHVRLLDTFGGVGLASDVHGAWARAYEAHRAAVQRVATLGDLAANAARKELVEHQVAELRAIKLQPGEDERIVAELRELKAVAKSEAELRRAEVLLASGEHNASALIALAVSAVSRLEGERVRDLGARLKAVQSEVEGAARELRSLSERGPADPERILELEDRLHAVRHVSRKYGGTIEAALQTAQALERECHRLENAGAEVELAEREVREAADAMARAGEVLTLERRKAARTLEAAVQKSLKRLGMAHAAISVSFQPSAPTAAGSDRVEFLFAADGGAPRPLAAVASGGEASRLALALRASSQGADAGLTVYDEADSGVGGAAADEVGRLLKSASKGRQVIVVTHLPQVAAHANTHFVIEKKRTAGVTASKVTQLCSPAERAAELARMFSGKTVTAAAKEAASTMLLAARPRSGTRSGRAA